MEPTANSDEQYIEQAWKVLQVGNVTVEEEACWAILERERQARQSESGVVYGVIDLEVK
jgi:hypothetical protein